MKPSGGGAGRTYSVRNSVQSQSAERFDQTTKPALNREGKGFMAGSNVKAAKANGIIPRQCDGVSAADRAVNGLERAKQGLWYCKHDD